MKAAVTERAGSPSVLTIRDIPAPEPKQGTVLINVKAFGLNRAELITRQGFSPTVKFPRVIGIECVGVVDIDTTGEFKKGETVAAMMGGMGRQFDGSYAEYTAVPKEVVFPFHSGLSWEKVAAIPEMYLTISGSLEKALQVRSGEVLLIRGGSSAIGLNACQLAKHHGLTVISTTRQRNKASFLKETNADHVIIDDGNIKDSVKELYPRGIDKVLELVGAATLKDSLACIKPLGMVCMTGGLGKQWSIKDFSPMRYIPNLGRLTMYGSNPGWMAREDLQAYIDNVESGTIELISDKVFRLDDIAKAHEYMESNQARGKIVVVV